MDLGKFIEMHERYKKDLEKLDVSREYTLAEFFAEFGASSWKLCKTSKNKCFFIGRSDEYPQIDIFCSSSVSRDINEQLEIVSRDEIFTDNFRVRHLCPSGSNTPVWMVAFKDKNTDK